METIIRGILEIISNAKTAAPALSPIKSIKAMYFGDPIIINASNLPALVVMPISEQVTSRGTQYDQADSVIKIKLIQDLKQGLGTSTPTDNEMTEYALKVFEERDSNGKIKTSSIIGALRAQPSLPYLGTKTCDWNGSFSLDYSFSDMRNFISYETSMTLQVKDISDRL